VFSGIVFDLAKVKAVRSKGGLKVFEIKLNKNIKNAEKGMSIAINGVCLTASLIKNAREFAADVTAETMKKSTLSVLRTGSSVNVEFPVTPDGFLSGHIVQGHVDCAGEIKSVDKKNGNVVISVNYPEKFARYIMEKGSVTVDGISLTAFDVKKDSFKVSVIPETFKATNVKFYNKGTKVNLEFDIISKYVERQINKRTEN
jgi:riboflavin synthase